MKAKFVVTLIFICAVVPFVAYGFPGTNIPSQPVESATGPEYVNFSLLGKIADRHAQNIWGENISRGKPLFLVDMSGKLVAYVFPFVLNDKDFPEFKRIFNNVRDARNSDRTKRSQNNFSELCKKFGSVYVSATKKNYPIPRVDHSLHAYFLNGELAQQKANDFFGRQAELRHLVLANSCDQYFEFSAGDRTVFINAYSLEIVTPEQIHAIDFNSTKDPILEKLIASSWLDAEIKVSVGVDDREQAKTLTKKLIDHI
ncbi:MAG: hypothetical protein GXO74_12235, partial [Calditrichaeota bacterium]|nr:hypothetical protein [Calditrichota bacterium]